MYILQRLDKSQTPETWTELYRCKFNKPLYDELRGLNKKVHRIVEEN